MSDNQLGCVLVIFFLRREGFLGNGHQVVSLFHQCYAIDNIGGGAREVIRNRNGSFGTQYFLHVMNERTSFAPWASAFESSGLVISL